VDLSVGTAIYARSKTTLADDITADSWMRSWATSDDKSGCLKLVRG